MKWAAALLISVLAGCAGSTENPVDPSPDQDAQHESPPTPGAATNETGSSVIQPLAVHAEDCQEFIGITYIDPEKLRASVPAGYDINSPSETTGSVHVSIGMCGRASFGNTTVSDNLRWAFVTVGVTAPADRDWNEGGNAFVLEAITSDIALMQVLAERNFSVREGGVTISVESSLEARVEFQGGFYEVVGSRLVQPGPAAFIPDSRLHSDGFFFDKIAEKIATPMPDEGVLQAEGGFLGNALPLSTWILQDMTVYVNDWSFLFQSEPKPAPQR